MIRESSSFKSIVQKLFHFIYPPLCLSCKKILYDQNGLCPECWGKIEFIRNPLCDYCGYPLIYEENFSSPKMLCGRCIANTPPFEKARAAIAYKENGRTLISSFKLHDRLHYLPLFTSWLAPLVENELLTDEEDPILIPIPMHPFKLFLRRYNQAALLTLALGKKLYIPYELEALKRTRLTKTQGGMNARARRRNVKNAFALNQKTAQKLKNKTVIIIDDVHTTGATLEEAIKEIRKAEPQTVKVLTLARTLL